MTPDPFDPERLGRPVDTDALRSICALRLPRPGKGEPYLGGPIPLGWAERAANLPGKAWHLACALWFEALCGKGKSPTVTVPQRTLRRFGLATKSTYYRALAGLERAGLVRVEQRTGRPPRITILPTRQAQGRGHDPPQEGKCTQDSRTPNRGGTPEC